MNVIDEKHPNRGVCVECFADESIKAFVREHALWNQCDFCRERSSAPIAAPIDAVTDFVREGLESCWKTDADKDDFDDEGHALLPTYDTVGMLRLDWMAPWPEPPIRNEAVVEEICQRLGLQTWYTRPFTPEIRYGRLRLDWGDFCERIKHKSRFFFSAPLAGDFDAGEPRYLPTVDLLDDLADLVRVENLATILRAGKKVLRARQHDPLRKNDFETASALGPPTDDLARFANRMSPAGIVMFYGAYDAETARREVFDHGRWSEGKTMITVGTFVANTPLRVVDLRKAKMPPVPSIFDPQKRPSRSAIQFLRSFAKQMTEPIVKDGTEHVEYVPTQVVAEYFRRMFKDDKGNPVQGILYDSCHFESGDHTCCVLFLDAEQCGGKRHPIRPTPITQVLRFAHWEHFNGDAHPLFRSCGKGTAK